VRQALYVINYSFLCLSTQAVNVTWFSCSVFAHSENRHFVINRTDGALCKRIHLWYEFTLHGHALL